MFRRKIIDGAVSVIGLIMARRKIYPQKNKIVKVNLGCGLALAPGWINIDASLNCLFSGAWLWLIRLLYGLSGANRYYTLEQYSKMLSENVLIFHDLSKSLPFPEDSVDVFYSSHFFEHLFKNEALRLMSDCYLALRKGGVLRIAIPDLEYAIEQYKSGKKREMLENYFFVEDLSSYLARHKYMYDFELISDLLSHAGFKTIKRCTFRNGITPDIEILDNRPEETLFVEAIK